MEVIAQPRVAGRFARIPVSDRLAAYSAPVGECRVWCGEIRTNPRTGISYGWVWHNGRHRPAHRVAIEVADGIVIPRTLDVDHLCRNTLCVRRDHLEVVTRKINQNRAMAARESCLHGHDWATNKRLFSDGWRCGPCREAQIARATARRRARV